jgi:hypothetical protein
VSSSGYELLPVPEGLTPVDSSLHWKSVLVDYARHPAYADLVAGASWVDRLSATLSFSARFLLLLIKRAIRYEMIPSEYRSAKNWKERAGFVATGLKNILRLRGYTVGWAASPCVSQLATGGCAVLTMPADRIAELDTLSRVHFDALAARRGRDVNQRAFDESRTTADRRTSPELFDLIERIFIESGLFEAASAHLGREARLIDINPQINDPSDSFWRDIFDDRGGGALPKTAYCHRDASGGDLKAIFYMSDVGAKGGPFTYAIGSNRMAISKVDDLLSEANDHNGLSATDLATRRRFSALPARLRQKGSFGNDLLDDSAASAAINGALWRIEAPKGSIVLFDTKGIHRGGMVEAGERRVITCVLG